jgi:hypothetical protein
MTFSREPSDSDDGRTNSQKWWREKMRVPAACIGPAPGSLPSTMSFTNLYFKRVRCLLTYKS